MTRETQTFNDVPNVVRQWRFTEEIVIVCNYSRDLTFLYPPDEYRLTLF